MENKEMPAELKTALEQWADENLKAMGIFKGKIADYEKWQEKAIRLLQSVYSYKTIEMILIPKNNRKIDAPDYSARLVGQDGHSMEIFINVKDGIITDSSFQTDGCKAYIASGNIVSEIIKGKRIADIDEITQQHIIDALGGLPKENEHCALLAVNTLKKAIMKLEEK